MSDIVPFLKNADWMTHGRAVALCQKAADEIEQLRGENAHLRRCLDEAKTHITKEPTP